VALADQEAWYATLGYRFKKVLPYVTYSEINEGDDKSNLALKQHSVALGMRFELGENAALKFEALKADPDNNNHGLFDEPVDDGKVFTVTMDVIF
jgi:predicted porin